MPNSHDVIEKNQHGPNIHGSQPFFKAKTADNITDSRDNNPGKTTFVFTFLLLQK